MIEKLKQFSLSLIHPHPARDWIFILALLLLLFVGLLGYAGYLFMGIKAGTISGQDQSAPPPLTNVSRAEVTKMLEAYRVREANFGARNF